MKTHPIEPASIHFEAGQPPRCARCGDVYHPAAGAAEQARHVFLAGNGLPGRWQGRDRFVVLETGFGLGNNFLATWAAWRADPHRCRQLVFVSVERHPPVSADLARAPRDPELAAIAAELVSRWPPLEPNVHVLDFEAGRVRLLLALGDARQLLRELPLQADAVYLDGFAPARDPQGWEPELLRTLARKAVPGTTAATWCAARALRDGLRAGGFEVNLAAGMGGKRDITVARYQPSFVPKRLPGRDPVAARGHALIVGAGLAGAAAADALVRQGWTCTVLDRAANAASQASGNPGGILHGTAHAQDGVHARFTRAAALLAQQRYRQMLEQARATGQHGQIDGLVRVSGRRRPHPPSEASPAGQPGTAEVWAPPASSRPLLGRSPLYVTALESDAARDASGLEGLAPAWLYPGGGWMSPRWLSEQWLRQSGIRVMTQAAVAGIERDGAQWFARDAAGAVLAQGDAVVLCTGADNEPLWPIPGLGLQAVRGQVTWFTGSKVPLRPLAGHGYALGLPDGRLVCGATVSDATADFERSDQPRDADHRFNLERLEALCGLHPAPEVTLGGRVGWRAIAHDRLPVVGAVPLAVGPDQAEARGPQRQDQCRFVPREPGLFVLSGLASRGLTWAPLAAEVLAAWMTGAPVPLEADLLDAIDPARGVVRRVRG